MNETKFQQIIEGNFGLWPPPPPPDLHVPIFISVFIGSLTDPLLPDSDNVTIIVVFL